MQGRAQPAAALEPAEGDLNPTPASNFAETLAKEQQHSLSRPHTGVASAPPSPVVPIASGAERRQRALGRAVTGLGPGVSGSLSTGDLPSLQEQDAPEQLLGTSAPDATGELPC